MQGLQPFHELLRGDWRIPGIIPSLRLGGHDLLGFAAFVEALVPVAIDPMPTLEGMSLQISRADELEGCIEGSAEDAELASIVNAIQAYEEKRWPLGKVPGGKG